MFIKFFGLVKLFVKLFGRSEIGMKRSKIVLIAAVVALGCRNADVRAEEVYNCKGVWTTKPCNGNSKPVTNLPPISRAGSFEAPTPAPAAQPEARGSLEQGEAPPAAVRSRQEREGQPGTSAVSPIKTASPEASLEGIERRIEALSRAAEGPGREATTTHQEQLRLRTQLKSICSYISQDTELNTRFKRQCRELNVRLERIGE